MNRIINARQVAPLSFLFTLVCMVLFSSTVMAQGRNATAKRGQQGKVVKNKATTQQSRVGNRRGEQRSRREEGAQRGRRSKGVQRGRHATHRGPKRVVTRKRAARRGHSRHHTVGRRGHVSHQHRHQVAGRRGHVSQRRKRHISSRRRGHVSHQHRGHVSHQHRHPVAGRRGRVVSQRRGVVRRGLTVNLPDLNLRLR